MRARTHTQFVSVFSLVCIPIVAVTATIVSAGKPTTQSSTFQIHGGVSDRAVDGNTNGDYWLGSCTHTDDQAKAWWTIDLQATYAIQKVTRFCSTA